MGEKSQARTTATYMKVRFYVWTFSLTYLAATQYHLKSNSTFSSHNFFTFFFFFQVYHPLQVPHLREGTVHPALRSIVGILCSAIRLVNISTPIQKAFLATLLFITSFRPLILQTNIN